MKKTNVLNLLMIAGALSLWQTAGAEECPVFEHDCYYDNGDYAFGAKLLSQRITNEKGRVTRAPVYRVTLGGSFSGSTTSMDLVTGNSWVHPHDEEFRGTGMHVAGDCGEVHGEKFFKLYRIDKSQAGPFPHVTYTTEFEITQRKNGRISATVLGMESYIQGAEDGMQIPHIIKGEERPLSCSRMPAAQ